MINHKRQPSLHKYFICTNMLIYYELLNITQNNYIELLKIYYTDKNKVPDINEIYDINPKYFKLIDLSIYVSVPLKIYELFIDFIENSFQGQKILQNIFKLTTQQIIYITDYTDYLASDEDISECKEAFINSISKNIFNNKISKYNKIIINRIEFEPKEFEKLMTNTNKYCVYNSTDIIIEYINRYRQKPRKYKDEIEYICINKYVYRVDNLF